MFHIPRKFLTISQTVFALSLILLTLAPPGSAAAPVQQAEAEWLVMLYQVADDEILEQDIMFDFQEAELIGSTDAVHIVSQVDRFEGSYDGMDDWTSTKRYYITSDDDFETINSEELEDMGEVNMAEGQSLVEFITWAVENYPAQKYALFMEDHGAGWTGGFNDPDPGGLGDHDILLAQAGGDAMWLMELDQALDEARSQTGIDKFDLTVLDVCLMATAEVFTALEPHTQFAVASEETIPGFGQSYAMVLAQLIDNPGMDGEDLAKTVADNYVFQDITLINAEPDVAEAANYDTTLSVVDTSAIPALHTALDDFIISLEQVDADTIAQARAYAQAYESTFGEELPSPFIDLGHFAQLLEEIPEVSDSAANLLSAIQAAVIAERHGQGRPGSTGMTIHFPVVDLYTIADNFEYTTIAQRFADATQWDEFLAAHFSGGQSSFSHATSPQASSAAEEELFQVPGVTSDDELQTLLEDIQYLIDEGYTGEDALAVMEDDFAWLPETVDFLREQGVFDIDAAPGSRSRSSSSGPAKPIQLAPINLSAEVATADAPVIISTDLSGSRLGYVYSFIGRFLPREDVLIIEDIDYIFADESKQVGGVTYPIWPQEGVSVDYEWSPTVYAISDGQTSVRTLFRPETYGDSPTYMVEGIYTFSDSGNTRSAKMYFRDNEMTQIFGFTGENGTGAPREIKPKAGDTFTLIEQGFNLSEDAEDENYRRESGVLTFGPDKFFIEETPAPSGNYIVGITAEDLDGQTYEQYEGLFVVSEDAAAVDGFVPYVNEALQFALLHPEGWVAEEDAVEENVLFSDDVSGAVTLVQRLSFPDAATPAEADDAAVAAFIESIESDGELQNLEFITPEAENYVLGAFDGKIFEFTFELDGVPMYGSVVAATPEQGTTFGMLTMVPDENFDTVIGDIESIEASFDVLISGLSKEQAGPPPPEMAETLFTDDFSDPTSGLIEDEEAQDWGRGYYDAAGQYVFELNPNPGAIYDYYPDETLPDAFLLEVVASYSGAQDNAYGLIFQVLPAATEDSLDQFYTFRITGDGFYTVEKNGETITPLIDWTYTNAINQGEQTENILTVEGVGDGTYHLYLNGQQINSFTDAQGFSGGTFGLTVDNFDEENPATFRFDDLTAGTPAP